MKDLFCALLLCGLMVTGVSCRSAEGPGTRPAAVAGAFYPADPAQLAAFIDNALAHATPPKLDGPLIGLVAPHAGYQFSGGVAATSFALLKGRKYKRVVLIGPSHVEGFGYSSIFDGDAYTTPLGKVSVDREFARKLASGGSSLTLSSTGHAVHGQSEHSLEVELPFLQRTLGTFTVVPVIMGDQSYRASRELGMALAKLLRNDNETLIVASSDLSHYHTYDEAETKDHALLNGITQGDFLTVSRNLNADVWEACGGAPIVATMIAADHLGAGAPQLLKYANSGDVTGDKGRVVGYAALAFAKAKSGQQSQALTLSDPEKGELLRIARESVETAVRERRPYEPPLPSAAALRQERGAFVTLKKRGELRGCIGYTVPNYPVYLAVRDVAAEAALRDPRFPPVRPDELKDLEYEISVLSPFHHVLDVKEIRVGEHGLLIRREGREGLLLPQVPVEQGWDRVTFLDEVAMKAGLASEVWQDAKTDLFTFTATVFSEHEAKAKKAGHP